MKSSGEVGRVNGPACIDDLIHYNCVCQCRGKVNAKGKGEIDMYFVVGTL